MTVCVLFRSISPAFLEDFVGLASIRSACFYMNAPSPTSQGCCGDQLILYNFEMQTMMNC